MAEKLSESEIKTALESLDGWTHDAEKATIAKEFKFKNFSEAWAFMARVALYAEKQDHHPDWANVYNTVNIELTTHDAGGLTKNDTDMARVMNEYAVPAGR